MQELTQKNGEQIVIHLGNQTVGVTVLSLDREKVRLGITAPTSAVVEHQVEAAEKPQQAQSLLQAFFSGVGSVMEMFPPAERFDRWRIKDDMPENEYAQLFRAIWETSRPDDSKREAKT